MASTDINICTRALVKIGAHPIASFNDETAQAEIAGLLYPGVRDALLSAYPWSFATAQITPAQLAVPPIADYPLAYAVPNDFLRVVSLSGGGAYRVEYKIQGQQIHTAAEDVVLTYIYAPPEEDFPPYFNMALVARLAAEFCLPITENSARAEILARQADQEFARARQIDAQQDTPNAITQFSLIDARG